MPAAISQASTSLETGIVEICVLRDPEISVGTPPQGKELVSLMKQPYICALRWSPDGSMLAACWTNGRVAIWRTEDWLSGGRAELSIRDKAWREIEDVRLERINDIVWNPAKNRSELAIASRSLWTFDVETGAEKWHIPPKGESAFTALYWGEHLLAGNACGDMFRIDFDSNGPNLRGLPESHRNRIMDIDALGDGHCYVTCSAAWDVRVWDSNDWSSRAIGNRVLKTDHRALISHELYVTGVAGLLRRTEDSLTPSVVSVSGDRSLRVWNATGERTFVCNAHERAIRDVAISPNGRFVATSGLDHVIKIRETLRWTEICTIDQRAHLDNLSCGLCFHPGTGKDYLAALCNHDTGITILDLRKRFERVCPNCGYDAEVVLQDRFKRGNRSNLLCPCCERYTFTQSGPKPRKLK